MCQLLKHGGPDNEGIYANEAHHVVLGHRRLSLIDLSASGNQPMSYAAGRLEISYNGEIYNFKELKSELQRQGVQFRTHSDTEVILAAFEVWGTKSFERLRGMFAFALWDNREHKLYLVRDPGGIKPLYYSITKEGIAFASEVRALRSLPWLQEENDAWQVYLMAYGHLPEPITVLKKVQPLQKGHFLCFDVPTGRHQIKAFREYSFTETIRDRKEAIHLLRNSLSESVKSHLISDAPIGAFLSGGIDSSVVSLLAAGSSDATLHTLSLYFEEDEFSEKKYQDLVLEKINCNNDQYLLKESEFHAYLPQIISSMDQPSCDGINTWFISKSARDNGLKAVLSGIGGDELLGGYPSFSRMRKVNMLEALPRQLLQSGKYTGLTKLRRLGYLSIPGATGKYLFLRGQFIPYEIARHLNISEEEVWQILNDQPDYKDLSALSAPNQASWMETNMFMQNQLLRDGDVMSMAHGIEIRVPFLDNRVMELTHSISSEVKYAGAHPKQLLIDAFKDVLPEPIWNRPKMGFGFPFKKWLAKDEFIQSVISPDSPEYMDFTSGSMHWSKFLSLVLIKNNQLSVPAGMQSAGTKDRSRNSFPSSNGYGETKQVSAPEKNILFLTLRTFSGTGGIEKVSKLVGKALHELQGENGNLDVWSMYDEDKDADAKYFPTKNFKGYGKQKINFMAQAVNKGRKADVVILSHVNLLPVGYLIKIASPKTKLILIAHGIEVWEPFNLREKRMIPKCDHILCVSEYTRKVLEKINKIPKEKLQVLNNCLDPFLEEPIQSNKDENLLAKYGFKKDDIILMTLTRLASTESYKGYDKVLEAIPILLKTNPGIKYLIVGNYDAKEKKRLDHKISELGVEPYVAFSGFVPDEELAAHFNLADIYIMPSWKEGFGIVFIEAMFYNKPVIAGNKDGSVDALLNGKLGLLVNPENLEEITTAINTVINNKEQYLPDHKLLMENFGYEGYREKWREVLENASC